MKRFRFWLRMKSDWISFPRFARFLAWITFAVVSLYTLWHQGMSFDGAINAQAALNFYAKGVPALDYEFKERMIQQIGLPF